VYITISTLKCKLFGLYLLIINTILKITNKYPGK